MAKSRSTRTAKQRKGKRRAKQAEAKQENKVQLQQALAWLIDEKIFTGIPLHGNTSWQCSSLVCLALLWVWSNSPQLTEAFVDARAKAEKLGQAVAVTTYQGLMKALVSATPKLMPQLQKRMHTLMEKIGGKHMRIAGFVPIAMDGSKETAARTISNERALRPKNYGQGKNAKHRKRKNAIPVKQTKPVALPPPQAWITLLWHMGLGLPWCWKVGASNASERDHVKEMVTESDFPDKTLFVGDAGFVGYMLWKLIIDLGYDFVVRVGANVDLLNDLCPNRREGKEIVYCWPKSSMTANLPPLRLRLVKCKVGKNEKVWLLTSVLDKSQLKRKDLVLLYERRWGIEIQFRALKQTFDRRKLRCRNAQRVLVEIEWSIFGMAAIELMALKEQMKMPKARPDKLSFAQSLTVVRHALNNLTDRPDFMADMRRGLRDALIDDYDRKKLKAGRYKPKQKHPPSCGEPNVTTASRELRKKHREMAMQNAA